MNIELGMHDAVVNGNLVQGIPTRLIFVANSTERDTLTGVMAGQIVVTYGCANVWQKKGDGTWATIK